MPTLWRRQLGCDKKPEEGARRLYGFKFRREHPVGGFIGDFCCMDKRLILELDGGQHREQRTTDSARTRILENHGFRVLRFWDHNGLQRAGTVLATLVEALAPLPVDKADGAQEKEEAVPQGSLPEVLGGG